jgi:very-short-patch-repair endonuclease
VVPYVEDRRNALIFNLKLIPSEAEMATLQAALKEAVQKVYQLERSELAVSPLPTRENRNTLLFFEAAEGGAGVLRLFIDDPHALAKLAKVALDICHFDPETGKDVAAEGACSRACDQCLLDYGNQRDHDLLDRRKIRDLLLQLSRCEVVAGGPMRKREDHIRILMENCDSQLERRWLQQVADDGYALPSHGQYLIEEASTRPDFFFEDHHAAIYIDGPPHDTDEAHKYDSKINADLMDAGYMSIRFHHGEDWSSILREHPSIFGPGK